jgi:DNA-binding transcriptional regulator YiaG
MLSRKILHSLTKSGRRSHGIVEPQKVKALRGRLRLSQAKMAELLGVSEDYIFVLEKGTRKPGKHLSLFMNQVKADPKRFCPRNVPKAPRRGKK